MSKDLNTESLIHRAPIEPMISKLGKNNWSHRRVCMHLTILILPPYFERDLIQDIYVSPGKACALGNVLIPDVPSDPSMTRLRRIRLLPP